MAKRRRRRARTTTRKKTGCKIIRLGKGRGTRYGCYDSRTGMFKFVTRAAYNRRTGARTTTRRRKR